MPRKCVCMQELGMGFDAQLWEVWFAWHPVRITIVDKLIEVHDEATIECHSEWRWLRCVARRPVLKVSTRTRNGFRMLAHWAKLHKMYDYGPATNALTQPLRRWFYGKF